MLSILYSSLLLVTTINYSLSANILAIYPTPSVSHQIVFQRLTKDLLSRGHNLTVLTPNPLNIKNNPNLTEIDLSSSYVNFQKRFNYGMVKDFRDAYSYMRIAFEIFIQNMEDQMACPDMKKFMSEKEFYSFDIMIYEHTGHFPYLAFAELYKIPVIGITSFETGNFVYQAFGSGSNIFTNVEQVYPFMAHELTFSQRWQCLKILFWIIAAMLTPPFPFTAYEKFMNDHFPEVNSSAFRLIDRVELLMVNTHPALGFVRPLVPNTVQLGFLHVEPPKPIEDGQLKTFLDTSRHGVIYMSLGTNIKSKDLPAETIRMFIDVFKTLDYDILWKFEDDDLPDKSKNVMIRKWLPQADLLAHPNIKLFITQCGHQSCEEGVDRAVPMVMIPVFADQPGISVKLQSKGIGRFIYYYDLEENLLRETITEVLKPEYKKNAIKLRELVYDQPMTSREKAVWWIEYFIRHNGTRHLDYPGRLVPFYRRLGLDFIAVGMILIYVIVKILKKVLNFFRGISKVKND